MDGLEGDSQGGTFDGDVIITGDLNVQGGQLDLGVGPDGWSNVRSADAAFGLDLEAPLTKKIRLINDVTPIVEIDTNLNLIGSSGSVGLVPATPTTTYDFIYPMDMGIPGLLLTTQGPGLPTYWSAGAVGPGGTVTSVDMSVPAFLSISGNPITTAGVLAVTLSGTPLPVLNGGTGTTTSTGTGSVVLSSSPSLTTPNIGVATGLIINLNGTTSGTVSIRVQPVAGTYNYNLPTTAGTAGQVLTSQGGGVTAMTWTTPAPPGTGTVTSVAMTVPTFLSVSGSPITTNGTFTVTLSGTPLPVLNGGTGTTTATGTAGSVVLSVSPTITGTLTTSIISASGDISTSSTTASTTTTTGALKSAGGLGVVGNANIGGTLTTPNFVGSGSVTTSGVLSTSNTTASTSTTTGSFITGGGAGIGGDLFVKQSLNVNYGGGITFAQIKVSPNVTGGASTIAFYRDINNGSFRWELGHSGGDHNFSIFSSESASTKLSITPSGPVTLPSGVSSTTFVNITGSTSGTVTIQTQGIAGTYNYNLPTTAGTSGQVLTSAGGLASPMTWTTPTTGTVTSVNMTVPTFLSVAGGPITSTGTFTVTLSGTPLPVLNGGTGVTTSTGSGSNVLSTSPTITTPTFVNPVTNAIGIAGSTSGVVSIFPQALFTSYNFNLPTTAGTVGQVLTSQGGSTSAMTWTNVGTGSVTSVAIAVPAFLSIVSGSPIVSAGTITIGLSGTPLPIANGGTSTTTATGTVGSSNVLQDSPTITGTLTTGRIVANSTSSFDFTTTATTMMNLLDPTLTVGNAKIMSIGRSLTGQDCVLFLFAKSSPGQGSYGSLQLFGSNDAIRFYVNNLPATSTTTGTVTIQGGLGTTSSIFSGGAITATGAITTSTGGANITGNSTFTGIMTNINSGGGGVRIQPSVSNGERSLYFQNVAGGGIGWAMGVGLSSLVNDNFFIFNNTIPGQIVLQIAFNTGLVSIRSLNVTDTTPSTSTTTGSIISAGGLGVVGAINAGGPLTVTTNTAGSTTLLTNSFINTNNTVGPFINGQLFPNVPTNSNMYIANGIATTANNCALLGFHPRPSGNYGSLSIYGGPEIQYFNNGNVTTPGAITASSFNSGGGNFTYNGGSSAPWTPTLTCTGHTISYTTRVGNYIKIGQQVTACFNIVYDCLAGANNDLLMSLPFSLFSSGASIGYATCILEKSSDLTPGQETADVKTYVFTCDTNIGTNGRFSRHTQGVNAYFQYGGAASFGAIIRGTITYMTSAAA